MFTAGRYRLAAVAVAAVAALAACSSSGGGSQSSSSPAGNGTPTSGGATTSATAAAAATGSPIVIGSIGTYSGFSAATSGNGKLALQAWADYVNANGGVAGHPVNVIIEDDNGSATKALAAAKDLVENKHAIAIVGQHEAGLESSWASYVASKKVPVIGGNSSAPDWLSNPDFFPTSANALNTMTVTIYATVLAGKKSFGTAYCAEVPGCAQAGALAQSITSKLGLTYAAGVAVSATAPSYAAQCLTLKNKGAEAIFAGLDVNTTKRLIADCAKQGYKPVWLDVPQNWSAAESKNSVWDGAWLTSDTASWLDTSDTIKSFNENAPKYEPKIDVQNTVGTAAWVAAEVFKAAVEKSGATADVTSADVLKGLYALGPDFNLGGAIAPVTYTAGKPATQKPCGWFLSVSGGQVTAPKGAGQICVGS